MPHADKLPVKLPRCSARTPAGSGSLRRLVADLFYVARRERKLWIMPLILLLLLIAALLAIASLAGPVAPFIYPLL